MQDFSKVEAELGDVIADSMKTGSLAQTLTALLRSARSVRDRLSSDTWRIINVIDKELNSLRSIAPENLVDALDELDSLVTALTAFTGLTLENMNRGRSWRFLDTGRRLERALQTTRLLQSTHISAVDQEEQIVLSDSVLTIVDSLMTYRRRYRYGIKMPELLELVIYDENNPRSLAYQLFTLEQHITRLPQHTDTGSRSELERLALETATLVRLADVNRLAEASDETSRRETLETFLNVLATRLPVLSDTLTATYFRVAETPHQLVQLRTRTEA
jgi:uncharacterized alpha-E superfamily protein